MESDVLTQAALEYRRRERRDGIWLAVLGVIFAAAGVFLIVIGGPWFGLVSICFGAAMALIGVVKITGDEGPLRDKLMILGALAFTAMCVFMILSGILTPEMWGWRSGIVGVIGGALGLAFAAPATVILIVRTLRKRTQRSA